MMSPWQLNDNEEQSTQNYGSRTSWLSGLLEYSQLYMFWKSLVYTTESKPVPTCVQWMPSGAVSQPTNMLVTYMRNWDNSQSHAHESSPARCLCSSLSLNLSSWTPTSIKFICQSVNFHQAPNLNFPRTISNSESPNVLLAMAVNMLIDFSLYICKISFQGSVLKYINRDILIHNFSYFFLFLIMSWSGLGIGVCWPHEMTWKMFWFFFSSVLCKSLGKLGLVSFIFLVSFIILRVIHKTEFGIFFLGTFFF